MFMGAEMQGMAVDGARDGANMWGAQRGGVWAHVRGVDTGKMHGTAMCAEGTHWWGHDGCDSKGAWGATVEVHGA